MYMYTYTYMNIYAHARTHTHKCTFIHLRRSRVKFGGLSLVFRILCKVRGPSPQKGASEVINK